MKIHIQFIFNLHKTHHFNRWFEIKIRKLKTTFATKVNISGLLRFNSTIHFKWLGYSPSDICNLPIKTSLPLSYLGSRSNEINSIDTIGYSLYFMVFQKSLVITCMPQSKRDASRPTNPFVNMGRLYLPPLSIQVCLRHSIA